MPEILATISLKPPFSLSLELISSIFHFFLSVTLVNILNKSPTNRPASSPPVPALISKNTSFSSSSFSGIKSFLISKNCDNYNNDISLNGIIDSLEKDKDLMNKIFNALVWHNELRRDGIQWNIYSPSKKELYPNIQIHYSLFDKYTLLI